MTQAESSAVADRVTTRPWELDLSLAGSVHLRTKRPTKHKRQKIACFLGREGTIERFALRQTIPQYDIDGAELPTQAQYGAVMDFYLEPCETRWQASTLLSARDYAEVVARRFSFTAARRKFIWTAAAAFILADADLRSRVRAWNIARRNDGFGDISAGIANHKPYKRIDAFAVKLVDDMRAAGSEIFG
ncbi:hypothetical protein [Sphingobium mellinum]|uniref:hypothetical protein n=1 Tax=Sphingobium mellinum TaxID=1387166 RepID=UPI0030EF945C